MFPVKEISEKFKKEAFARLDQGKAGKAKMLYVDANLLIDLCLAYDSAAVGDTENLEYSIKVLSEEKEKLSGILETIALRSDASSKIWELATNTGVF